MKLSTAFHNHLKSKKILRSVRSQIISFIIILSPITFLALAKEILEIIGVITTGQVTKGIDIFFIVSFSLLASSIILSLTLLWRYNNSIYRKNGACCRGCNVAIDDSYIEIIVETLECKKCKHKFTNDLEEINKDL